MRRIALAGSIAIAAFAAIASACGGGLPAAPPDLVTITGQAVQGSVPAAGALVYGTNHSAISLAVGDASLFPPPAPVVADGTGHFTIGGFGTSYDVVIFPESSPRDATIVQNLTRRDPRVTLDLPQNTPLHTCHISTTWTTPPPAGATIAYFLTGPAYPGVELLALAPVDSNLVDGLTATWRGSISTTVNMYVMVLTRDAKTSLPASYLGYATTYAWLIDQREAPFVISLLPLSSSEATVNLQAPGGYSVVSADMMMDLSPGSTTFNLAHFDAPNGSISVLVPDMPFNRMLARGTAKNGGDVSAAAGIAIATPDAGANVALAFPTATQLTAPNDAATAVDSSTLFSWNGGGVNELIFTPSDPANPKFRVMTSASSMTLTQFQALANAAIPAGAHYSWTARRWPDFATTDDFDNATVDLPNANSASSSARTFTFAP